MAKCEFTPGPWEAIREYGPQEGLYVKQIGDIGLFLVKHTFDGLEAEANIRLMAASPYMHEALLKALNFIENGVELGYIRMPDKDSGDSALETPSIIRRALAKAGG